MDILLFFSSVTTFGIIFHAGVHIQLQKKFFDEKISAEKPDKEFIDLFSGVVMGSKWPSLASLLSLTSVEIEEVKR